MSRRLALVAVAAWFGAAIAPSPAGAAVTRTTLAGPSAATATTGTQRISLDMAPDGSVAAAFLTTVGGQARAFVARGTAGNLGAPVQVDAALAHPSSSPVVGVGTGGRLFVAFANGLANAERLYAVTVAGASDPLPAPVEIGAPITGWKGLELDVAASGDGYLTAYELFNLRSFRIAGGAATAVGGTGAGGVLNGNAAEQAEAGEQRGARLAVDPTGASAVLAWSETAGGDYRVWARRLTGTAPADIGAAVDPRPADLAGKPAAGGASDMTWVASGGGVTEIAFRQQFTYAPGVDRARLIVRSFDGTNLGAPQVLDGLGDAPAEGAEFPRFALNASGQGMSASYRQLTFTTEAATRAASGAWSAAAAVPGFPASATPGYATTGLTDAGVGIVAALGGPVGGAQVLSRISGGAEDGAVQQLSDPSGGAASALSPVVTAPGVGLVAFRQGAAATSRVEVARIDLPPATTGGSGGGAGDAAPISANPGATRPQLTRARLSTTRPIARANRRPSLLTGTPRGVFVQFTLDRAARVSMSAERLLPGRRARGGRCVAPARAPRTAKRCTRTVKANTTAFVTDRPAGTTRLRFSGRLGGRAPLPRGTYRLVLVATDPSTGLTSTPRRIRVTLR